jgi:hypothetical protein
MKITVALFAITFLIGACASKNKLDSSALEKYPHCYHKNIKISNKCIEKNNAGENVTAVQLENTAYPGQYK